MSDLEIGQCPDWESFSMKVSEKHYILKDLAGNEGRADVRGGFASTSRVYSWGSETSGNI